MGYFLKAYIGRKESLSPIYEEYTNSKMIDLNGDFSMIPMTYELFDEIKQIESSPSILTFDFLTSDIEQKTLEIIGNAELAYVESKFIGGQGGHIGLIWKNGERQFLGKFERRTMNSILRKLGVLRTNLKDEFETVGLDKYRKTEDWIE